MRSEKEMFDLIIGVAQTDDRIRAVCMNGSRTNPNVPKDRFQDFDIVYVVTETASFLRNKNWIHVFGELLMIQEPDQNDFACGIPMNFERSYAFLMLFTDGNRIDLHIVTKEFIVMDDKLTVVLLDKDNVLPPIPAPTDVDYHVKKPTGPQYASRCNNFWWCLQNVAKGMRRDELPYAKHMFEQPVRASLDEMVSWWIGSNNHFQISTGKMGKHFKKHLPEPYWELYKNTYADSNYDNMWNALFAAGDLFRILAADLAQKLAYTYPNDDDRKMTEYLKHVRDLPIDATEIH